MTGGHKHRRRITHERRRRVIQSPRTVARPVERRSFRMNFEMKELPRQQSDRVRDQRIERVVELVTPAEMLEDLPLGRKREDAVLRHRAEVKAVLDREDDRLLVVVGPCSVHDPEAAIEYAQRLSARAEDLHGDLCIAMRTYFEKPRTTTGWKGLINDPHLDDSRDVNLGSTPRAA